MKNRTHHPARRPLRRRFYYGKSAAAFARLLTVLSRRLNGKARVYRIADCKEHRDTALLFRLSPRYNVGYFCGTPAWKGGRRCAR